MKKRLNKQQWQALLIEQVQSGLSVAAFCRNKDLSAKDFYYHRRIKARQAVGQIQSFVRDDADITLSYGKVQLRLPASTSPQWLADLAVALK